MDVAGLILGIPGLVQSCVHGYRFVCEMIDLDKNVFVLRLRYRIEESRLVLWGRFWGMLAPDDDTGIQPTSQSLDDLLEIPGIGKLIEDILGQILGLLNETQKMSERYEGIHSQNIPLGSTEAAKVKGLVVADKKKKPSTTARIRWAIKDKSTFESSLVSLTSLNDGLEKLLPRRDRVTLGRALVGEVLSEEGIVPGEDGSGLVAAAFSRTGVIEGGLKTRSKPQKAKTTRPPRPSSPTRPLLDEDESSDVGYESEHLSDREADETESEGPGPDASMQIPVNRFVDLSGRTDGFSMEWLRKLPKPESQHSSGSDHDQRSFNGNGQGHAADNVLSIPKSVPDEHELVAERAGEQLTEEEAVFVEWRSYEHTIAHEELQMALDARREQLSHLFRSEGKDDTQYVMQCLGYVLYDKTTMGLVFRPPAGCTEPPLSLNEIMRTDFENGSATAPDLETRLHLAKKLSTALYQLQCAGWLHRKISSHNIMFFPTSSREGRSELSVGLTRPFLTGWQTARYDDQYHVEHTEGSFTWRKNPFLQQELPYVHPLRPAAKTRFKRSFDVYSMGIVLAEIAFWEPMDVLGRGELDGIIFKGKLDQPEIDKDRLEAWSNIVLSVCKAELAGEVGGHYSSAVLWCLEGVKAWHAQQATIRRDATKADLDREVGLEKAFFWNVLNQFDFLIGGQNGGGTRSARSR